MQPALIKLAVTVAVEILKHSFFALQAAVESVLIEQRLPCS